MSILFVAPLNRSHDIGLYKKISCQASVFSELNEKCVLLCFDEGIIVRESYENGSKVGEKEAKVNRKWRFHSRIKSLQFAIGKELTQNSYNYLYFRDILITGVMKAVIRHSKKAGVKVIMEIPTYPYYYETFNSESNVFKGLFQAFERKRGDRYYIKNCDLIPVIKCNSKVKMKANMLEMYNCVNEDLPLVTRRDHDYINIIGVGHIHHYHGYDRLIKSLAEYYKNGGKRDIRVHIIGNGDELTNLGRLTEETGMQDRVFFEGVKTGDELHAFYEECDVALGTLCLFKRGADIETAIKISEALYQGIPVISSGLVPMDFVDDSLIFTVSNDESIIDIDKLVKFADSAKNADYDEIRECLRWKSLLGKMLNDCRLTEG